MLALWSGSVVVAVEETNAVVVEATAAAVAFEQPTVQRKDNYNISTNSLLI